MLLTLLPLAGWAQNEPIDLDDGWSVVVDPVSMLFTGQNLTPNVSIKKGIETVQYDSNNPKFNVSWSGDRINVSNAGYTVTVTANMTKSVGVSELTKKFWILKNDAVQKTAAELPTDVDLQTEGVQVTWTGNPINLVKTAPVVTMPDNNQGEVDITTIGGIILYSVNEGAYKAGIPTATKTGAYTIKYKVEGNDNYDGVAETLIGTVNIVGTPIVAGDVTAPTAANGLKYDWANNAAVEHRLLSDGGSVDENLGQIMYSLDNTKWSDEIPTASAAGTHNVYWKVVPEEGKNEYIPTPAYIEVTIAAATPVITAATGKDNLVYNTTGDQQLLDGAATADINASSAIKYVFRYNADVEHNWDNDQTAFSNTVYTNYTQLKGTDAGSYQIKSYIETAGNYKDVVEKFTTVVIAQAPAFTSAPTANNLTWNGDANGQQLITAGANTVANKVQYKVDEIVVNQNQVFAGIDWTTDISAIKAVKGLTYTVHYKTNDANYAPVNATNDATIQVTIKKKALSVKVNDVTKTYDGTTTLTEAQGNNPANYTIDGGLAKFTFITPIEGKADFAALNYANNIPAQNKNVGPHAGVVTVTPAALEAINAAKDYYYEYTIIPGKLTVNKAKLTITAHTNLHTDFGTALDISNEYDVAGLVTVNQVAETIQDAFGLNVPVLTSSKAAAANYNVGTYAVEFTPGTLLEDANYEMSNEGENHDGYVIGQANFVINPDANKHIVITVVPKTKEYGESYDWSNMLENKDYYVSGLIEGDVISGLTFRSTEPKSKAAGHYELIAEKAAVTNSDRYPGGIVYNNSTFDITPKELIATVAQQYVYANAPETELNQDAWDVEGLQYGQTKADLFINENDVALAFNTTEGAAGEKAVLGTPETYTKGIKLTITNPNYTLRAGSEFGILTVTSADAFVLAQNDPELPAKLAAANTAQDYQITFGTRTLEANTWYTMVLPFDVKTTELVANLKANDVDNNNQPIANQYHSVYAIVNRLNQSTSNTGKINFNLEMLEIPANEPFLIKVAEAVDLKNATAFTKKIDYKADPKVECGGNEFIGTYTAVKDLSNTYNTTDKHWGFLANSSYMNSAGTAHLDNIWYNAKLATFIVNPMEAYLHYAYNANGNAPVITIEDFDFSNNTTAIKTLNTETMKAIEAEGMYNLNGMKLNSVPTQKGVYIINGKKVVIK